MSYYKEQIWKQDLRYQDGLLTSQENTRHGLFMLFFLGPNCYAKQVSWLSFIAKNLTEKRSNCYMYP